MRRIIAFMAFAILAWSLSLGVTPSTGADEVTPGLLEARQESQRLLEEVEGAQSRLGELDAEIVALEQERTDAEAALDALRGDLEALAVDQYVHGVTDPVVATDIDEQMRASALAGIVGQRDTDSVDQFRAVQARLDAAMAALDEKQDEESQLLDDLEDRQAQLTEELVRLEQLELQRLEAERLEAERQAREAAEAEERREAQRRADQIAREQAARRAGQIAVAEQAAAEREAAAQPAAQSAAASAAPVAEVAPVVSTPSEPVASVPSGGGIVCPVPGSVFRNGFGDPRPGGRSHQGIDMTAPTGTPILAPVGGTVTHGADTLGGNNFNLAGADGRAYYGAHLSAYGQGGSVSAGTVIGYVGETGHAYGAHLHIEISVGGSIINPYGELAAAC